MGGTFIQEELEEEEGSRFVQMDVVGRAGREGEAGGATGGRGGAGTGGEEGVGLREDEGEGAVRERRKKEEGNSY